MVDPRATTSEPGGRLVEDRQRREGSVALVDTATLFGGATEIRLVHRGQEYRLRITRQGKLILTK